MNTYIKLKALLYSLALSLAVICLSSCGKTVVSEPGDGLGRDRVQPSETTDSETTMETESETTADTASDGKIWDFADGKYVFNFPERSDEGLATIDEMYDMSTARFDDQPDDWFFGKTVRDNDTGEVTYVWHTGDTQKIPHDIPRGRDEEGMLSDLRLRI